MLETEASRSIASSPANKHKIVHLECSNPVLLDHLVLCNIASKQFATDFVHYQIFQERVSRTWASAIKAARTSQELSLKIEYTGTKTQNKKQYLLSVLKHIKHCDWERAELVLIIEQSNRGPMEQLESRLRLIFSRFQRFRCLNIGAVDSKRIATSILSIIKYPNYFPKQLNRLQCTGRGSESELIGKLSLLLFELQINFIPNNAADVSRLWKSIGMCANLRKFYSVSDNNWETPNTTAWFLKKYLESSKIVEFQGESRYWQFSSLQKNEKLRKIYLDRELLDVDFLSSASVESVIKGLRCVSLLAFLDYLYEDSSAYLHILRTLPESGRLSVKLSMENHSTMGAAKNPESFLIARSGNIIAVLMYWMQLSNYTRRFVRLHLQFQLPDPTASIYMALQHMSAMEEYSDLSVEQISNPNRFLVRCQSAKICIKPTYPY